MSNKEIEAYLKTIEEGFIESERILLKRKLPKMNLSSIVMKTGILLAFQRKTLLPDTVSINKKTIIIQ